MFLYRTILSHPLMSQHMALIDIVLGNLSVEKVHQSLHLENVRVRPKLMIYIYITVTFNVPDLHGIISSPHLYPLKPTGLI